MIGERLCETIDSMAPASLSSTPYAIFSQLVPTGTFARLDKPKRRLEMRHRGIAKMYGIDVS